MLLLFSHSGFSDTDANGITMKNLLSAYPPEEKAQFYCDVAAPDFTAAHHYFRVTDVQVLKALLLKKSRRIFTYSDTAQTSAPPKTAARKVPAYLKKRKYNFTLKWLREKLRAVSPWGHRALRRWIEELHPEAVVYMVGESHFMDKLVLKTVKKTGAALVLYNSEAYRLIDLNTRKGLERAYYRASHKLYAKLAAAASLVIYNSDMLKQAYEARFGKDTAAIVAYNTAEPLSAAYDTNRRPKITYFGNLGVGRDESLLTAARCLRGIDPTLTIDVYGNAREDVLARLRSCEGICYHGFLEQTQLREVIAASDILLHVESFDPEIMPKLRYAFSTKIAQCLCSGRCFVSFAPKDSASSQYLLSVGAPLAANEEELTAILRQLLTDTAKRIDCAQTCLHIGLKNHTHQAERVRREIGAIYET